MIGGKKKKDERNSAKTQQIKFCVYVSNFTELHIFMAEYFYN